MTKFKCCNCDFIIEEEELEKECPKCGIADWEEIMVCDVCGKGYTDAREMPFYNGICEDCLINIIHNDGINLEFIKANKKNKVDFYINYILGGCVNEHQSSTISNDLVELLETLFDLKKLAYVQGKSNKEYLEDFFEGDLHAFADWYVDREVE